MHQQTECIHRAAVCEWCGATDLTAALLEEHTSQCELREFTCPLGCELLVTASQLQQHCDQSCQMRQLDCGLNCGSTMLAADVSDHEQHDCPLRIVQCCYGCQCELLTAVRQQQHQEHECRRRPVDCARGCGMSLCHEELPAHSWVRTASRAAHIDSAAGLP